MRNCDCVLSLLVVQMLIRAFDCPEPAVASCVAVAVGRVVTVTSCLTTDVAPGPIGYGLNGPPPWIAATIQIAKRNVTTAARDAM